MPKRPCDEDDTSLAARLKNITQPAGTRPPVFEVPADTDAASRTLLTVTDERLDSLARRSDRMNWPADFRAQVSPNGRGGATRKQLLQTLFAAYNGPGGRRHAHATCADQTVETRWLVDAQGGESRHAVVTHKDGVVMTALFGDGRIDPRLLEKMARKTSHQNSASDITGAFTKGIKSLHGKEDMKAVLDLLSQTAPLRSFRSPDGFAIEERRDQDAYLATIHHANGKIIKVERYAQPKSDEELLKHMNKAFSKSRTATGAAWMSPQALQKQWVKSEEPSVVVKQEPQEWSRAGVDGYLFDSDGRPLSREALRIDERTPILVDTCGLSEDKAARYRQQLRSQVDDVLRAWEQGQLPKLYDQIGLHVVPTASYGWGVRTTKDIPAGTLIGLYGGMVFDAETWESRYRTQQERDLHGNYLLQPHDKGSYIDSRDRLLRNPMGFLNHPSSKSPCNLKTLKCGPLVVGFVTTRDVACGDELTFSYGWHPHFTGTARTPHDLSGAD